MTNVNLKTSTWCEAEERYFKSIADFSASHFKGLCKEITVNDDQYLVVSNEAGQIG